MAVDASTPNAAGVSKPAYLNLSANPIDALDSMARDDAHLSFREKMVRRATAKLGAHLTPAVKL